MKSFYAKFLPHILALVIGFGALVAYFPSAFFGSDVVNMHDINRTSATSKEARDFEKETGEQTLWTNSMFGGMPTFQMSAHSETNWVAKLEHLTNVPFPPYLGLIFTIFLGFYLLGVVMGIRPWLSFLGAFAFAFSTYFFISLGAGHTGKLRVIGYIAPVFIGILITMRGKRLLGAAITCLTVSLAINAGHYQVVYYIALMVMVYMIVEAYYHFKEGRIKDFVINGVVLAIAAIIAVGPNVSRLWTTNDYAKETIRGGKSELVSHDKKDSGGLDKDYAMAWSYGKMESFTLLIPDLYGRATGAALSEKSEVAKTLTKRGIPKKQVRNIIKQLPLYWGDQPFISGPVYLGAIIIFLFILALFVVRGKTMVWLLSTTIFFLCLSWGRHFSIVTDFFFYYFPMYNKFRVPSMMLSMVSLTIPLLAVLGLNEVIKSRENAKKYLPQIKKAFYITAGLCLLFILFGGMLFSFTGDGDAGLAEQGWPLEEIIKDRESMMRSSAIKSLVLVSLAFFLLLSYAREKLSDTTLMVLLCGAVIGDLWFEDKRFVNSDHMEKRKSRDAFYVDTQYDRVILQDKDPNFRVMNLTRDPFKDAMTSYHHKSIGGYHAAKLIRYQDMIEYHLGRNNIKTMDMLNTRYFIMRGQDGGAPQVSRNPNALGNAWFINKLTWVENANEEINSLNDFTPAEEAVVDESFKPYFDGQNLSLNKSTASIALTEYKPDHLTYQTNVNGSPQFAVFSEIYYEGTDHDWKVYIDGEESSHIRVNYILRGMIIPSGEHTIEFKFEPISFIMGEQISLYASILIVLILGAAIVVEYRNKKPAELTAPSDEQTD